MFILIFHTESLSLLTPNTNKHREAGLEGRVLYIDLDTVIVGLLDDIAGYVGPFAALSVAEMANEHRAKGMNSSLMAWDADSAETVGSVYELLLEAYDVVSDRHGSSCTLLDTGRSSQHRARECRRCDVVEDERGIFSWVLWVVSSRGLYRLLSS